jgi:hypothetical protein
VIDGEVAAKVMDSYGEIAQAQAEVPWCGKRHKNGCRHYSNHYPPYARTPTIMTATTVG